MPWAAIERELDRATDHRATDHRATDHRAASTGGREVDALGQIYELSLSTPSRRRSGSHYTSPAVAAQIAEAALAPLFSSSKPPRALDVTVCDPSMGSGACLLAAARWLSAKAVETGEAASSREAWKHVADRIHGADIDPMAATLARISLWLEVADPDAPIDASMGRMRVDDGLACTWSAGFDVVVGNPPWISFVGRAAQPLEDAVRQRYAKDFAAFAGYRNLQGLFLERAASMLRPGGRMAFLVPSSMSEQVGYAPTRRAVARYVEADREMADVGEDAFVGVVQPCMIFAATSRAQLVMETMTHSTGANWSVVRSDLDAVGAALLARLTALPALPPELFGERGVQTSGAESADLAREPDERRTWPLLSGSDVGAFRCGEPTRFADPARAEKRFREARWSEVALVVRQTAMFPIVAHARGHAFRNSLLAGFETEHWSADFLVAWLNAAPVRWLHFHRFRDARQGMPQVKVGHLRSVPAPKEAPAAQNAAIADLGRHLGERNAGVTATEQAELDALVAEALGLGVVERELVARWAAATPTPVSRRGR